MSTYIFRKSETKIAEEGEYLGKFIEATECTNQKGQKFIVVKFKVQDENGVNYKDKAQWFREGVDSDLLDQFIEALDCDDLPLEEVNLECKDKIFGFEIKDKVLENNTYHNVVSFWETDDEWEEIDDDEEDDGEEVDSDDEDEWEEEEETDDEEENEELPFQNYSPRARRSSKRW